jgi:hypothetical protein
MTHLGAKVGGDNTIIRLICRVESGLLEDLKTQIEGNGPASGSIWRK